MSAMSKFFYVGFGASASAAALYFAGELMRYDDPICPRPGAVREEMPRCGFPKDRPLAPPKAAFLALAAGSTSSVLDRPIIHTVTGAEYSAPKPPPFRITEPLPSRKGFLMPPHGAGFATSSTVEFTVGDFDWKAFRYKSGELIAAST